MTFPAQEHKIDREGFGPDDRKRFRLRVDDDTGIVTLLRGTKRADEPLPRGLTPGQPIEDWVKRDALLRFVRAYADGDLGRYPALVALLERRVPDARLDVDPVEAALSLGESYLFVQGPPGSGKTWQGARMAVALMRAGKRVGVTSLSHKAIHNLLRAIQHEADEQGFAFRGAKRARDEEASETAFESRCIVSSADVDVCADPSFDLVAGTGWALSRDGGRPPRCASGRSTCSSSTRRASSRSPTCSRRGHRPARSSCSATRTSCRRSRRARTPRDRGAPCSSTCSGRTSPCRPSAGSSSPRPGACGPSSARSPRTRTTRGGSATRR